MNMPTKKELAKSFFGSIKRLQATGGFKPEPESLTEDFINPRSVIHLFCRGCGNVGELTEKGLRMCLDSEQKPYPEKIETGTYLASDGCPLCTGEDGNFEIKKI
jgi:hypothetical protein